MTMDEKRDVDKALTDSIQDFVVRSVGPRTGPRREPYSTAAVIATAIAVLLVPVIALGLSNPQAATIWLAVVVLMLAVVRLARPDGTWIAARGRLFDVVFGVGLGLGILALAWYATLPAIN